MSERKTFKEMTPRVINRLSDKYTMKAYAVIGRFDLNL